MNLNTIDNDNNDCPTGGKGISSLVESSVETEKQQPEKNNYTPATLDQVKAALKYVSPDLDRNEWAKIGMAIKSEFDEDGFELFKEWSTPGKSYKLDTLVSTWESIRSDGGINIGYLFKQAKAGGWKFTPASPDDIKAATARKKKNNPPSVTDDDAKYKAGASDAKSIWGLSSACDAGRGNEPVSHPYLDKKKIKPHGAALSMEGDLLIPRYYIGDLVSLQTIKQLPDGTFIKRNLKGARAKGSYHVIGSIDGCTISEAPADTSTLPIFICEGFATGCSLNEKSGNPVVVVFSCNNLKAVALQIIEQYPDRRIVIAADNDTKKEKNTGLLIAKEVAELIKVDHVYPDFEAAGITGSDFNDYFIAGGTADHIVEVKYVHKKVYTGLPDGYYCDDDGLVSTNGDEEKKITNKPVLVKADTHNIHGDDWSILVWFKDKNNTEHTVTIPKGKFHSSRNDIPQMLANAGLPIETGMGDDLIWYLSACKVQDTRIIVSQSGWLDASFVLPNEIINPPPGDKIIYNPAKAKNIASAVCRQGTLEEWQQGIKDCSPVGIFLLCHALAAPVRFNVGGEGIGIHLYDTTSKGKTTSLMLAASVWGNGADPGIAGGSSTYIQKWNATQGSLEDTAEIFNDLLMVIDEIGESDPKEFGQTIYKLTSGKGKGRLNQDAHAKLQKAWRLSLLSAGELGVADFIESGGSTVKGGQLVRIMDIDLQSLPPLFKDAADANAMKVHTAEHYGCAGPLFLERVPDIGSDFKLFNRSLLGSVDSEIAERNKAKYDLIAYAGIKAVQVRILPFTEDQIIEAIKMVFLSWLDNLKSVSDVDRGIEAVKNGILRHQARFEVWGIEHTPQNRIGYHKGDMYHIFPKEFKKLCAGVNDKKVKQELKRLGILTVNKSTGLNSTFWIGKKNVNVVSVRDTILELS